MLLRKGGGVRAWRRGPPFKGGFGKPRPAAVPVVPPTNAVSGQRPLDSLPCAALSVCRRAPDLLHGADHALGRRSRDAVPHDGASDGHGAQPPRPVVRDRQRGAGAAGTVVRLRMSPMGRGGCAQAGPAPVPRRRPSAASRRRFASPTDGRRRFAARHRRRRPPLRLAGCARWLIRCERRSLEQTDVANSSSATPGFGVEGLSDAVTRPPTARRGQVHNVGGIQFPACPQAGRCLYGADREEASQGRTSGPQTCH